VPLIPEGHTKIRRYHGTHGTDFIGYRWGEDGAKVVEVKEVLPAEPSSAAYSHWNGQLSSVKRPIL